MKIVLTPAENPPSVGIGLSAITPGATRVNIRRLIGDDTLMSGQPVRGTQGLLVGTTAQITDWDAPVGRQIQYQAEVWKDTVLAAQAQSEPITLPDAPVDKVWLSDPLDAASARLVDLLAASVEELEYPQAVEMAYPLAQPFGRASTQTRRLPEVFLTATTNSPSEARQLRHLLLGASSLLARFPATHQGLAMIFGQASLTELPTRPWLHRKAYEADWQIRITPTGGPATSPIIGGWTYQQLAGLGSYQELAQAYGHAITYRDLTWEP